jgi:hypothetical protein
MFAAVPIYFYTLTEKYACFSVNKVKVFDIALEHACSSHETRTTQIRRNVDLEPDSGYMSVTAAGVMTFNRRRDGLPLT